VYQVRPLFFFSFSIFYSFPPAPSHLPQLCHAQSPNTKNAPFMAHFSISAAILCVWWVSCPTPVAANPLTCLSCPLPPAKHEEHAAWGVFSVFGIRIFRVLWLACPLPYPPTPPPISPSLSHLLNTKNTPHGACFSCLACSEHENREHVRVFCVLWLACPSLQPPPSTGDARHTHVSPFPSPPLLYLPNTKNGPMWCVFRVWHCSTCPHLLKMKNAPSVARFSCSAPVQHPSRPLHPPSCRTRKTHPDGCVFRVRRTLSFPCSAHSISPPSR